MSQPIVTAKLYRLGVGQAEDGSTRFHSILHLPSDISERRVIEHDVSDRAGSLSEGVSSITLDDWGDGVSSPGRGLDDDFTMESTYNIVMVETSGNMEDILKDVVDSWNDQIADNLDGVTDIFSFGSEIHFKRSGTKLDHSRDKIGGVGTNLTLAIKEIHLMINKCPHKHVRVFLVTGGAHTGPNQEPQTEIDKMSVPPDKRVEVFLLGITNSFPIDFSMQIRSKLHTGAAGISTIFWAKKVSDIASQMEKIKIDLKRAVKVSLSEPANTVPYLDTKRDSAYPGEYLYFDVDPEILRSQLRLRVQHEPKIRVPKNWRQSFHRSPDGRRRISQVVPCNIMASEEIAVEDSGSHELTLDDQMPYIPCSVLFENLYRQWNAVLIQLHTNKQYVPLGAFDLMKKSFELHLARENVTCHERNYEQVTQRKNIKSLETGFATLINTSRNIISMTSKYKKELDLAEAVLNTTVQCKYDYRLLKMKGYCSEEWKTDADEFKEKLTQLVPQLRMLPEPLPEESCAILFRSFLGDLQGPGIFELLEKPNHLEFLQQHNFTGIPIYVPVKSYSQINPWTQHIKNICVSPYAILSQGVMETKIAHEGKNNASDDKEIYFGNGDSKTAFNVIVPIIPRKYADILKPLVSTKVYALGCTFCILKNATILDHTCHIAALGCVWMKTIKDFPLETRPHYIKNRIADVEATARLYLDRRIIKAYIECLLKKPEQALCTESAEKYNNATIKCESLVKPAFFLHLSRHNYDLLEECQANIPIVIQRVVTEFIGRCLSSSYKSTSPFIDLFLPAVSDDSREKWLKETAEEIVRKLHLSDLELLQRCTELENVQEGLKTILGHIFKRLDEYQLGWREQITQSKCPYSGADEDGADSNLSHPSGVLSNQTTIVPNPNMNKVRHFRNSGCAGQVSFNSLLAWANEMMYGLGLPDEPLGGSQDGEGCCTHEGGSGGPGSSGAEQGKLLRNGGPMLTRQQSVYLRKDDIDYNFGNEMLMVYLVHALANRESRARALNPLPTVEEASIILQEKLDVEWNRLLHSQLRPKVEDLLLKEWQSSSDSPQPRLQTGSSSQK